MNFTGVVRQIKPSLSRVGSTIRLIAPRLRLWQRKKRVRKNAQKQAACVHFFFFPNGSLDSESYQASKDEMKRCMDSKGSVLHIPLIDGSSILSRLRNDEVLVSIEPIQIKLHDKCKRGILTIHGLGIEKSWHVHVDETNSIVTSKFARVLKHADKEMPSGILSLMAGKGMQIEFTPSQN